MNPTLINKLEKLENWELSPKEQTRLFKDISLLRKQAKVLGCVDPVTDHYWNLFWQILGDRFRGNTKKKRPENFGKD